MSGPDLNTVLLSVVEDLAHVIERDGAEAVTDALAAVEDSFAECPGYDALPHLIDGLREAVRTVEEARSDHASVRVVSRPGTRVTLSWARNEPPSERLRHIAIDAVNHAFRQTGGTP